MQGSNELFDIDTFNKLEEESLRTNLYTTYTDQGDHDNTNTNSRAPISEIEISKSKSNVNNKSKQKKNQEK